MVNLAPETLVSARSLSKRLVVCAALLLVTACPGYAGNYYLPAGRAASLPAQQYLSDQKNGSQLAAMQCLQGFFMIRNLADGRAESSSYGIDFNALGRGVLRFVLFDRQTCLFDNKTNIDTCSWRDAESGEEGRSHAHVEFLGKDRSEPVQYRVLTEKEWLTFSASGTLPTDSSATSNTSESQNPATQFLCADGFDVSRFLIDSVSREELAGVVSEYRSRQGTSAALFTNSEWNSARGLLRSR